MSETKAEKKPPHTAVELCQGLRLSARSRALLRDDLKPGEYLRLLVENKQWVDAIRLMARALHRRKLVWWVCLCVRHTASVPLPAAEAAALRTAVQWVLEPNEDKGKAAQAAAGEAGLKTPAGCAAKTAAYVAVKKPAVAAKLAAAAVLLAAAKSKPAMRALTYQQFVSLGIDVSYGIARWDNQKARGSETDAERI